MPRLSAALTHPNPGNPNRPKGWHANRAASASLTPTFPETISIPRKLKGSWTMSALGH
jgi:hypothetical protein